MLITTKTIATVRNVHYNWIWNSLQNHQNWSLQWFSIKIDQKMSSVGYRTLSYLLITANMFVIIEYVTLWKIMENEIFFFNFGSKFD